MIQQPGIALTILAFVLVIGPLVFIHELGHYLVGRWFGVKAEEFSIGFGRAIAGFTDKRGTFWKFGWLPLGGYVKFAGDMNPASQPSPEWMALPAEERAQTFQSKPLWQRALIVAAGPLTNFLFAILVLAAFAMVYGKPATPTVVKTVIAGGPAATAGLQPGDKITALGGGVNRFLQRGGGDGLPIAHGAALGHDDRHARYPFFACHFAYSARTLSPQGRSQA